jgi:hypothetical protein
VPFNIEQFKAKSLPYGGARPTLFEVNITMPPGIGAQASQRMRFVVTAASLPSFIVEPVVVAYFGRQVKYAGDRVFQDWQVTVQNDEDFTVRNAFEAWSNGMNALVSNRMDPNLYATAYKTIADVRQLGKDGAVIRKYNFHGIFPSQVDNIGLSWDAINQIETFAVNFSYDYYELDTGYLSANMKDGPYQSTLPDDNNLNQ